MLIAAYKGQTNAPSRPGTGPFASGDITPNFWIAGGPALITWQKSGCSAEEVPLFKKRTGESWITAKYAMLALARKDIRELIRVQKETLQPWLPLPW